MSDQRVLSLLPVWGDFKAHLPMAWKPRGNRFSFSAGQVY